MFAGEGGPERTNKRFHYVSQGLPAKRLSTAFDSVTLYGHDPGRRPDIYGKVGNSGVSICCLDDAKKLYSGFDLSAPTTSVSMTINGPAPMLLGFFMNAAIDQNCEKYILANGLKSEVERKIQERWGAASREPRATSTSRSSRLAARGRITTGKFPKATTASACSCSESPAIKYSPPTSTPSIKADTLAQVRGTVQADILKEDQAQNTCIFSTEFALRLMGDVQQYFIEQKVRNFYSVSISGYHIAEAGANPISQLAFTLANGFTYVEYYLSRGMDINAFAPNLSFFFSNGMDPEYAVMGRVARRLWAKALKHRYGADERSQMLKYHIQTSGRSLHAQEIDFNDIRTTLQALYAIYDNCNSLHTNAYDEAITTPTEESVRRAMAIQLIINKELGLAKNENPLQGQLHHRRAHRPGGRGRAHRVRPHHRTRRRAGRHGDHVPAQPHPGGKPLLRNAEAHRRIPDHRREHLPQQQGLTHGIAQGSDPRHRGREGSADPHRGERATGLRRRRQGGAAQIAGGGDPE